MFCVQCGAQVPDGSKFCTSCGAKLTVPAAEPIPAVMQELTQEPAAETAPYIPTAETVQESFTAAEPVNEAVNEGPVYQEPEEIPFSVQPELAQPQFQPYQQPQQPQFQPEFQPYQQPQQPQFQPYLQPQPSEPAPKKKKAGMLIGIIAGAVALIAVVIVLILTLGKKKVENVDVNLNDYIEVTFTGISGDGEAEATFDSSRFIADYDEKLVWTCKKKNAPAESVATMLSASVFVYLDNYYYLSNGDTVTLDIYDGFSDWGTSLPDFYANNVVISYTNDTITVEGLEEPVYTEVDPFENFVVTVSGTEGDTYVDYTVRTDLDIMSFLYITTDDDLWSLKNGDVIHFYVYQYDDFADEYVKDAYGMYPSVLTYDYTVEGLQPGYLTDAAAIPADFIDKAFEGYELVNAAGTAEMEGVGIKKTTEYLGYYFWTPKENCNGYNRNSIYLLFKEDLTLSDGKVYTSYNFLEYSDLYLDESGFSFWEKDYDEYLTYILEAYVDEPFSYNGADYTLTVYGFKTLDEAIAQVKAYESTDYDFVSSLE